MLVCVNDFNYFSSQNVIPFSYISQNEKKLERKKTKRFFCLWFVLVKNEEEKRRRDVSSELSVAITFTLLDKTTERQHRTSNRLKHCTNVISSIHFFTSLATFGTKILESNPTHTVACECMCALCISFDSAHQAEALAASCNIICSNKSVWTETPTTKYSAGFFLLFPMKFYVFMTSMFSTHAYQRIGQAYENVFHSI